MADIRDFLSAILSKGKEEAAPYFDAPVYRDIGSAYKKGVVDPFWKPVDERDRIVAEALARSKERNQALDYFSMPTEKYDKYYSARNAVPTDNSQIQPQSGDYQPGDYNDEQIDQDVLDDSYAPPEAIKAKNLTSVPITGKDAFASQYSDIENMLSDYKEKPKDNFLDFLKLTLARSAMSKNPNFLGSLAQGAGEATFDQQKSRQEAEKERLNAIKQMAELQEKKDTLALKKEELGQEGPLRAAQANYYNERLTSAGNKPYRTSAVLIKHGNDVINNFIDYDPKTKEGNDISPDMRQQVHINAEKYLREGLDPDEAYGQAITEVIGDQDKLIKDRGWFSSGKARLVRPQTSPQLKIPNVGDIVDGYSFIGGDPKNKDSWQKVR